VKVPTEAPELLAAAAGPSTGEKGAEQLGSQEQPFEWGNEQIWPGLTATERAAVVELLEKYRGIFAWSIYDLRNTAVEGKEFEVDFTDDKMIFAPQRRLSLYEYDLLKAYCKERVAAGLICKLKLPPGVKHPFVTQTVMPRKKDAEGNRTERRVCGDYRPHNDKTVPDEYPMPIADELFDDLGGATASPRWTSGWVTTKSGSERGISTSWRFGATTTSTCPCAPPSVPRTRRRCSNG
jgi:hypothetical protein